MSNENDKVKKVLAAAAVIMGAAYTGLSIVAKKKKADSIYSNDAENQNLMEGKKVVFVEDDHDKENADGKKGHLEAIGPSEEKTRNKNFYEKHIKRGVDKALSFGGLVLLSPVMGAIALAIKVEDPGPVLFTQKRVGADKQYFKLHKFRSMKMSTPHDVPTHMLDNPDQYITKVGKFIRAHSLDELPQIWDIFIGNMSVIGPRPALWNQDVLVSERDKYGANDVKPGLTGWAQINGRDELEIPKKARLDGVYTKELEKNSIDALKMDVKCFAGSIGVFAKDDTVVEGGTGELAKESHRTDVPAEDPKEYFGCDYAFEIDKKAHKKVLVVGKGSYIGETFVKYAEENYKDNFNFKVVDTLPQEDGTSELDHLTEEELSQFDIVYHLAGIAHADVGHVDDATKEKYYKVNTDLAIQTAKRYKEALDRSNKRGLFVLMSSMIVYGDSAPYGKERIINKNTKPSPANFYGDSKWQADKGVRNLADDTFKVAVIRPPMIYGKGSKGNYPTLAKLAKKLPIFPDVDNARSMLYVGNLCEFLSQLFISKAEDKTPDSLIFMPQNSSYTKTADMVNEIADASHHRIKILKIFNPAVLLADHVPGKVSGLVDKAFGNNAYDQALSQYNGLEYKKYSLEQSILSTEKVLNKNVETHKLKNLKNKNVLLIALPGYSNGIIAEMEKLGAVVDYIHDKPNEGVIAKTLGRLHFRFYEKVINKYYYKVLQPLKNKNYDYILSIRGEYTPVETLNLLRNYYPKAKMVLYMWDGLKKQNTRGIEKKWKYYDKVYTFDRIDYLENSNEIDFLPLYYYDVYLPKNEDSSEINTYKYDLSFIGTAHDDRIRIVKSVMNQCKRNGLKTFYYFYMPHRLVYLRNKLLNKNFKNVKEADVHYKSLPIEELYNIYNNSKCIIDVENRKQHGLTMRSIEVLGLRRKFITTNKDIVNYDFYNPNNILVIDRDDPRIDMSWFNKPYEALAEDIYYKYSLENWILEVLK